MCLGSDRDKSFTESVVKALAETFGITQVIGTAYNPKAQSAVERPHKEYNVMCRTFMQSDTDWDMLSHLFVWAIRTSSKLFNGMYSPYEVITGLTPRSLL